MMMRNYGEFWIDGATGKYYMLVSHRAKAAEWVEMGTQVTGKSCEEEVRGENEWCKIWKEAREC